MKTLQCLEAMHISQCGALLVLLVEKYLDTNHLVVSRQCEMMACRKVEMLMVMNSEVR